MFFPNTSFQHEAASYIITSLHTYRLTPAELTDNFRACRDRYFVCTLRQHSQQPPCSPSKPTATTKPSTCLPQGHPTLQNAAPIHIKQVHDARQHGQAYL